MSKEYAKPYKNYKKHHQKPQPYIFWSIEGVQIATQQEEKKSAQMLLPMSAELLFYFFVCPVQPNNMHIYICATGKVSSA